MNTRKPLFISRRVGYHTGMSFLLCVTGAMSNVGKTSLIEDLLPKLPGSWGVCKVTLCRIEENHRCPHGKDTTCGVCNEDLDDFIIEEAEKVLETEGKDTWRYKQAGAERVLWVRARPAYVETAVSKAVEKLSGLNGILFEGNNALAVLEPDLAVMVLGKPVKYKASAKKILDRVQLTGQAGDSVFQQEIISRISAAFGSRSAVILSGGRGQRIDGREKGFLSIRGKSFIEHKIDILSPLFDEIVLVVNRPELYTQIGSRARIVQDSVPYSGVLGALLTGLENCNEGLAFVTTSDTPFLLPGVAEYLLELAAAPSGSRPGHDGAVAVWEGKIEPLCAVYSTGCAEYIRKVLPKKRIRAFYHLADIVFAEEAEIRKIDPAGRSFININTAEDYARWFTPEGKPRL